MSKSLTETAKEVLGKKGKVITEELSGVGGASLGDAPPKTPNQATLRPSALEGEPPLMSNAAQDLGGATPTQTPTDNLGANASGSKDTSKSSQAPVPAEKVKKQEEVQEEVEISEELASFIDAMIAEGRTEEEIAEAVAANFEFVQEEKPAVTLTPVDMSEDIEVLFAGENLSEDFKKKAKTIFEAAVNARLIQEKALMEQAYLETLEEEVQKVTEDLSNKVDDYLNYVVEDWAKDNQIAIESSLRSELTEDFISGLRNLFAEHYIDLPEEKVDVVEEMATKVQELEGKLNEEIQNNVNLKKELNESKKLEVFNSITESLTDTQVEKMKTLVESVDFTDETEYTEKLNTLKESYFPVSVKSDNVLDKPVIQDPKTPILEENSRMAKYVGILGRTTSRSTV